MKTLKEWVSRQLETNFLLSSVRPLSFIDRESTDQAIRDQAATSLGASPAGNALRDAPEVPPPPEARRCRDRLAAICHSPGNPLAKVELLQIKFLRLAHRMGIPPGNRMVAKVLYRLHLAKTIRSGEADSDRPSLEIGEAREIAAEMEAAGQPDLDLSLKILLLGKTGVGKSATINSIFDQEKAETSAFEPATRQIREIPGTFNGIKVTAIDTPGLLPSSSQANQRHNRRVMLSIRRFIKRSPPDVILYFDRLDGIGGAAACGDLLLLKLITDVLGCSVWFNTIMVFTHSSAFFEDFISRGALVKHCGNSIQHCIHQAMSDARLEIPALSVENHPSCRSADGPPWRPELLLYCASMKVLADANSLLRFQNSIRVGRRAGRSPSLPHLLSSLLQSRAVSGSNDRLAEEIDDDGADEYDALPPFRALTKSQFEKLSKSQKEAYLDEMDYRETLLLKKQLKDELRQRHSEINEEAEEPEGEAAAAPLLDMATPLSFDPDCTAHRFRSLALDDRWVARPVLDAHGWDHDIGFDGVNIEASGDPCRGTKLFLAGQLSKDKKDCNLVAEGSVNWSGLGWCNLSGDVDLQAAGKDSVLTLRSAAAAKAGRHFAGCGVSLTTSATEAKLHAMGVKAEDSVKIGQRVNLSVNSGLVSSGLQHVAYGGGMELTLLGRDYPARDDRAILGLTVLAFDRDLVLGGALKSEFRAGRRTRMGVDASLNSRQLGRLSLKATTSARDLEVSLFALLPLLCSLLLRRLDKDRNLVL